MGFCDCVEDDGVLGIKPTWLWPRRRRVLAAAGAVELGAVAVVLESKNGKGEEEEELTGSRLEQTASSGRRRRRRIDGGGPWWPRRGKASGWRFGASGRAWVGGEEEGVEAEPLVRSEKRGEGGGCSYGERHRRLRSASEEGAREAKQGERCDH